MKHYNIVPSVTPKPMQQRTPSPTKGGPNRRQRRSQISPHTESKDVKHG